MFEKHSICVEVAMVTQFEFLLVVVNQNLDFYVANPNIFVNHVLEHDMQRQNINNLQYVCHWVPFLLSCFKYALK